MNTLSYQPKYSKYLLIFALLCLSYLYQYNHIVFYAPQSIHQFRQADCLSIALNYYQDDMNFFKPQLHNQMSQGGTSGFAVGEFPIIYYLVAVLWKIFGLHLWIFRLVEILFVFLGLLALLRIFESILKDSIWALMITLLLFTSPIVAFYSNNYLTNMPAFSLVLMGWYYFYKFYETHKLKLLYMAMLLFALAALLKVSSAISYSMILCVFFLELFGWIKIKNHAKLFHKPSKHIPPLLILPTVMFLWYGYASWFNARYGGSYTFNSVWPIWNMSRTEIHIVCNGFMTFMVQQIFNIYTIIVIGSMLIALIILAAFKKIPKLHLLILGILILGTVLYVLFWFNALGNHDYYLIDVLPLSLFVFLIFFVGFKTFSQKLFNNVLIKSTFFIFLVFNMVYCQNNMKMRYWIDINKPERFASENEIGRWAFMHVNYVKKMQAFETLPYYFNALGVKPTDKVISIPDSSINISLVLMNHKGWTSFGFEGMTQNQKIEKQIKLGAKYLLISDSIIYKDASLEPFMHDYIGSYENIDIFNLQKKR